MTEIPADRKSRIQEQLERILSSATFAGSERHRRFLRFVVEQALAGDTDKLNEFVLGFEVFNKSESFDPRIDSIVRVEARRLRERLRKYYENEGAGDSLVITLRPRSFVPAFEEPGAPPATAPARLRAWIPSHKSIAIASVALLCGAVATAVVLSVRHDRAARSHKASVIVLPFQNLAPAATQERLGETITEALVVGLAQAPGLRVISRPSGAPSQESRPFSSLFASAVQADYVVDGTVLVRDGRVVVSAKATDTRTQSYAWAETREAELANLGTLERELAHSIASRIQLPPPAPTGRRPARRRASSWEAYGAFLNGQYYWYQWDSGGIEKSIELFSEAVRLDPNYAPAWAWLSQGYMNLVLRSDGRDAAAIAKGRQAAAKALALDAQCAEAHAAVATFAAFDWDWPNAEKGFRRAIEIDPGWAQGHLSYAMTYLVPTGQLREATKEILHAHELDPLTRFTRTMLAEVLYFNRDWARAISEFEDLRKPVSTAPPVSPRYFLALHFAGQGRRAVTEMAQVVSRKDHPAPALSLYAYLLAKNGSPEQARAVLRRLTERAKSEPVSPVAWAVAAIGLGDHDEAFRQLQAAAARRTPQISQIGADPVFDPLRSDARYTAIMREIGLAPRP